MARRLVVDLAATRPVWRAPESFVAALRAAAGADWEVAAVSAPVSSDGDGSGGSAEAIAVARGAEVYIGYGLPPGILDAARGSLRWAHSAAAGVSASLAGLLGASDVAFTNSAGVHAEPMAEWAVGAVLHFFRGFDRVVRAQAEGRWTKDELTVAPTALREVAGATAVVFGLGGIGTAVARRLVVLGARVRAVRRHPERGGPPGVEVLPAERLADALDGAAVLVIAAPLTESTRGALGTAALDRLAYGAVVVHLSRGKVLEEAALLAALASGRVGAAALDVFAEEPLPAGHPFWTHPRVLVCPHVSAVSPRFWERELELVQDNWTRHREGRALRNRVDLVAGY
jgi:phosphoglycerate dehydrogenase-like enzyme